MNEQDILIWGIENLGFLGVGFLGGIFILTKSELARKILLFHLVDKHKYKEDPQKQYTILIQQLNYWIGSKGQFLVFRDKGRQAIFQDLIHIKLIVYKKYQELMATDLDSITNDNELFSYLSRTFADINNEIVQTQIQEGIPRVAVKKYQLWQRPSYAFTMSAIESIQFSQTYRSLGAKIEAILNIMTSNIELSLVEAERTLHSLNGSLTGQEYSGHVCGPL